MIHVADEQPLARQSFDVGSIALGEGANRVLIALIHAHDIGIIHGQV
jgi:hypothetical protein